MNEKLLEDIGLSRGEARVYLTLLDLGMATTGPIAKFSKISPSKVYKILDKLSARGLTSYVLIGKIKHFKPANPKTVLDLIQQKKSEIEEKENQFQTILPQLQKQLTQSQKKAQAEIYEGFSGLKTVFDDILNTASKNDEVLTIGISKATGIVQRYFIHFFKKQSKIEFKIKAIFNENARETAKERKNRSTSFRFMPKNIITPAVINIYKDKTIINIRSEGEQLFTFVITSQETAESFRDYFKLLWKTAST